MPGFSRDVLLKSEEIETIFDIIQIYLKNKFRTHDTGFAYPKAL